MQKHVDVVSFLTIVITFVLFVVALFAKGLTHDLLLEIGIFLVSLKLILNGYKNNIVAKTMGKKLEEIQSELRLLKKSQ